MSNTQITYTCNHSFYPEGLVKPHVGDQGFDVKVCIDSPQIQIQPKSTVMIPLGVKVKSLHTGWYPALYARSSLQKRGLLLANGVGVIDQGYVGEIQAPLYNFTDEVVTLLKGERVCQLVFHPSFNQTLLQVEELSISTRGDGGFGSTGV